MLIVHVGSTVVVDSTAVFAGELRFQRHVIDDQTDYSAAALIDVNHDGRIDIVCGGDWYEAPHWDKHFVADVPRIRGRPDGFSHLEFDVNRDGWTDVITVNYRSRSIKWMEHPGASLGPWKTHVAVEPGPMETGRLVDIDGDGQLDLLPNGANFAAWWEFRWGDGDRPSEPAWIRHDLPEAAGGHGLGFGDINGDGRGDIVGQNGWLLAPSDVRNGSWRWNPEFQLERASIPMVIADVDTDGDNDIVWCSAHGFGVYWLEQVTSDGGRRVWKRHAIDTSWSQGHSPLWVDLDGDGRHELVVGKRYMSHGGADPGEYDPIAIYRYQFDPATRTWHRWTVSDIDQRVGIGLDPKVADIDGDGDLDYMASGRSGLYWLENLGPGSSSTDRPDSQGKPRNELMIVHDDAGNPVKVNDAEQWGLRRWDAIAAIESDLGGIPGAHSRVPLDADIESESDGASESDGEKYTTRRVSYRVDASRQVTASLLVPAGLAPGTATGLVCWFEADNRDRAVRITEELANRGFVCLLPEIAPATKENDLGDQVWQVIRALDLLQATEEVHGERLGLIGDALAGETGMYAAAIDQRLIATVTNARRQSNLRGPAPEADHTMAEVMAAVAPRSILIALPLDQPTANSLKSASETAKQVFELRKVPENLNVAEFTPGEATRQTIFDWLQRRFPRNQ